MRHQMGLPNKFIPSVRSIDKIRIRRLAASQQAAGAHPERSAEERHLRSDEADAVRNGKNGRMKERRGRLRGPLQQQPLIDSIRQQAPPSVN